MSGYRDGRARNTVQCCDFDVEHGKVIIDQSQTELYMPILDIDARVARTPWKSPTHALSLIPGAETPPTVDITDGRQKDLAFPSNADSPSPNHTDVTTRLGLSPRPSFRYTREEQSTSTYCCGSVPNVTPHKQRNVLDLYPSSPVVQEKSQSGFFTLCARLPDDTQVVEESLGFITGPIGRQNTSWTEVASQQDQTPSRRSAEMEGNLISSLSKVPEKTQPLEREGQQQLEREGPHNGEQHERSAPAERERSHSRLRDSEAVEVSGSITKPPVFGSWVSHVDREQLHTGPGRSSGVPSVREADPGSLPSITFSPSSKADGVKDDALCDTKAAADDHEATREKIGVTQLTSKWSVGNLCCQTRAIEDGENYKLPLPADSSEYPDTPTPSSHRASFSPWKLNLIEARDIKEVRPKKGEPLVSRLNKELVDMAANSMTLRSGRANPMKYIGAISGEDFMASVVEPAKRFLTRNTPNLDEWTISWESDHFPLVCEGRESLFAAFILRNDQSLRVKLIAPDLPTLRNTYFDFTTIITRPHRGKPRDLLFSDAFVSLPGPKTTVVKINESLTLNSKELIDSDSQLLMVVTTSIVEGSFFKQIDLRSEFERLYNSTLYGKAPTPVADVNVVCEHEVYPASRSVLMARSEVFRHMLKSKTRAVIAITGAAPEIVKNLIDYVHTDRCDILTSAAGCDTDLPVTIKLFETACRFVVHGLSDELALRLCLLLNTRSLNPIRISAEKTKHVFLTNAVLTFQEGIQKLSPIIRDDLRPEPASESVPNTPLPVVAASAQEPQNVQIMVTPP